MHTSSFPFVILHGSNTVVAGIYLGWAPQQYSLCC